MEDDKTGTLNWVQLNTYLFGFLMITLNPFRVPGIVRTLTPHISYGAIHVEPISGFVRFVLTLKPHISYWANQLEPISGSVGLC
ncbi:MAG: hypothetical protein WCP85_20850 [Mariniphaga sp.]